MPSKKTQHLRREAQATLKAALNAHWAIHPPALQDIVSAIEAIVAGQELSAVTGPTGPTKARVEGRVAYVPIQGVIRPQADFYTKYFGACACTDIQRDLETALNDPNVDSIVLVVDSPGGSVSLLEETAQVIYNARGKKPITAFVTGLNASAAYYLSSAADKIVATPSSMIGSIGTVIMHASYAGQLEELGIEVTPVHYGKHKVDANPYQALSAQGKATLQDIVDTFGAQFVNAVATHRGITAATVKADFGEGKIFVASEALKRGLIDEVATMPGAIPSSASEGDALAPGLESIAPVLSVASINVTSGQAANQVTEKKTVNKIKALLYAIELIGSMDASDETVKAVVGAYCAAKGLKTPTNDKGDLIEAEVIKILTASDSKPSSSAPAAQAARDQETAEAREMSAKQYRERRDEIEAVAVLVNQTSEVVSADDIRAAIDGTQSVKEIQASWASKLTSSESGRPLRLPATPHGTSSSQEDKWAETAVNSLLFQQGRLPASQIPAGGFGDLGGISISELAAESLSRTTGTRRSVHRSNAESIASEALQTGRQGRHDFGNLGATAYDRPGSFPHLMSNLANKILSGAMELSEATFDKYTQRMPDGEDFKPTSVIAVGSFDTLDELKDAQNLEALKMNEELQGWIAIKRHGNAVKLTPVMVANDDLDGFAAQLETLAYAHDNTLNYLCLSILMQNPLLPDGIALAASARGNLLTSGGAAPSATTARLHRMAHRRMKGVGTNKALRSRPRVALVPPEHEDAALQTYASLGMLPEIKNPATDATLNVHRGSVEVIVEPDMEAFTNGTKIWYTFDTRIRTIVHRFMAGYGRGGRRETWFDPNNGCRSYSLEGRFNAAAVGWRGLVRNPGE